MNLILCVAKISYVLRGNEYLILDNAGKFFYRPDLSFSCGNHGCLFHYQSTVVC